MNTEHFVKSVEQGVLDIKDISNDVLSNQGDMDGRALITATIRNNKVNAVALGTKDNIARIIAELSGTLDPLQLLALSRTLEKTAKAKLTSEL